MFDILFFLVFLHYLADQTFYLAGDEGDYRIFSHSFIWAGSIAVGLYFFGLFEVWKCLFLLIGHFIIDKWESKWQYPGNEQVGIAQVCSFLQILVVVVL
jgi:hypothetical protein